MAQVDVTELLGDPDFIDAIQLIDRRPVVNNLGENILTDCVVNTVGSVQPAGERTVQRLPEALRVANLSNFWFRGTIVATAPGKYASVLVFKGVRYNVVQVFDWTNWGAGWCEGACVGVVPAL